MVFLVKIRSRTREKKKRNFQRLFGTKSIISKKACNFNSAKYETEEIFRPMSAKYTFNPDNASSEGRGSDLLFAQGEEDQETIEKAAYLLEINIHTTTHTHTHTVCMRVMCAFV